ncbi:MAG: DUF3857 domain-containing protein [Candidatus Aminicenantes bacterium]|nr:DUF3857 domain-containing protein [Candidatus Aminicenantes bacterium]
MKRLYISIIIILSAAIALFALPATDARFLNIEIGYRLDSDGSWTMEYQHQVRLDTYLAVNRLLGETFIVYNPVFQKLEILKAETTMADGRKVAAPENAFNEVLPFAAHGFADFSGLREMVVTHTGLERGAIVDLRYRIHTQPGFFPCFSGREALVRDFPVEKYKLEIVVPAERELHFRVFGCEPVRTVANEEGMRRYTFLVLQNKTAAHEPLAPALADPFIVFSATTDWPKALELKADAALLPAALAAKVEKLKAQFPARPDLLAPQGGQQSDDMLAPHRGQQSDDMLAALQKAVAVDIQNCGLGSEATGWQARPLERVFASNYATRLEKALLLRALLKEAGFNVELLGVAAGASFAVNVATPLQLGEFWLKVGEGSDVFHVDPWREQNEFFPYRCQGLDAWNFERLAPEKLPSSGWEANGVDITGAVQLDPSGAAAAGTLAVTVRGVFNRYADAVENSGRFIEGLLKKIFPVQKVEIKKLLQLTRHEIRVEAFFSGPWLKDAGAALFTVDACRLPGLSENMASLERRESPLALEAPFRVNVDLDLQPAAGLTLEYGAPDVRVKNEAGLFARSLVQEKNGHIRFSETCALEKNPVPPELYPRLRDMLKAYFTPDFWLVFKQSK